MTLILAFHHFDGVSIIGDSAWFRDYELDRIQGGKVFVVGDGNYAIGVTGTPRMDQILRYHVDWPEPGDKNKAAETVITKVVPAIRKTFAEHGFTWKENERESGGEFIILFQGLIFQIFSDFQVGSSADGHMATGCGGYAATVAMDVAMKMLPDNDKFPANLEEDMTTCAMHVCRSVARRNAGVEGPFKCIKMSRIDGEWKAKYLWTTS